MPSARTDRRVRYDGLSDWYDLNSGIDDEGAEALRCLVGEEAGSCLDLGCGTGQYFSLLAECGGRVVGLDVSLDQLQIARRRHSALVRADAESLPFASESFDTVAAIWVTTDVQDLAACSLRQRGCFAVAASWLCSGSIPVSTARSSSRCLMDRG